MTDDLRLALDLADAADAITMRHFRAADLGVRTKADRTPVSEADEAVERMLRERLARERPDDAVIGEEFGTTGSSPRRWVLDPIDATKNYVRGVPVFATLIALENEVGVVSAPAIIVMASEVEPPGRAAAPMHAPPARRIPRLRSG
jgi:histidinol-phosphatase